MVRLLEISQNGWKIFVDMDGVVADFHSGITKLIGEPHSEERYENDKEYKKKMWDTVKDYRKKGGELWYELQLLPDAMQLWTYIKKYNPTFLTSTGTSKAKMTEDEKRRWLNDKFGPHVPAIFARSAQAKKEHAGPKHILIDDKEKAIKPWETAGGLGILHTSASSTIAQLKKLGL